MLPLWRWRAVRGRGAHPPLIVVLILIMLQSLVEGDPYGSERQAKTQRWLAEVEPRHRCIAKLNTNLPRSQHRSRRLGAFDDDSQTGGVGVLSAAQKTTLATEVAGVVVAQEAGVLGLLVLEGVNGTEINDADVQQLTDLSVAGVAVFEFVERDVVIFADQWGGAGTATSSRRALPDDLWPLLDINVAEAWETTRGSNSVVVAVIDTGMDVTHPDLRDALWTNPSEFVNGEDDDGNGILDDINGANFHNYPPSGNLQDEDGHGTHVAGIIGGRGRAGQGMQGIARVRLMTCKALGQRGIGNLSNAVKCIDYALIKGADIIVASWGTYSYSRAMETSITEAGQQGVVFVTAAGNDGSDNDIRPQYPSSYAIGSMIAVAAADQEGNLWNAGQANNMGASNYGRTSVDVAAPGSSIYSTYKGGGYAMMEGTSQAAPHAAGVAALLISYYAQRRIPVRRMPENAAWIVRYILDGAACVDALSGKVASGGKLNAGAAMRIAVQSTTWGSRDCVVSCWRPVEGNPGSRGSLQRSVVVRPLGSGAACPDISTDAVGGLPSVSASVSPQPSKRASEASDHPLGFLFAPSPPPPPFPGAHTTSRVDCLVGPWGEWSSCKPAPKPNSGDGRCEKRRTREVILPTFNGGAPCPATLETLWCPPSLCELRLPPSEYVGQGSNGTEEASRPAPPSVPSWMNLESLFGR